MVVVRFFLFAETARVFVGVLPATGSGRNPIPGIDPVRVRGRLARVRGEGEAAEKLLREVLELGSKEASGVFFFVGYLYIYI